MNQKQKRKFDTPKKVKLELINRGMTIVQLSKLKDMSGKNYSAQYIRDCFYTGKLSDNMIKWFNDVLI